MIDCLLVLVWIFWGGVCVTSTGIEVWLKELGVEFQGINIIAQVKTGQGSG